MSIKLISSAVLGLAAVAAIATAADAQVVYRSYGPGYYAPAPYLEVAQPPYGHVYEQYEYRRSGTRGRLDLGAEPNHPEGPGNARVR